MAYGLYHSYKGILHQSGPGGCLVGNVSWYMTLISTATAILGFTFIYLLLKRFPGWDIATIMKDTLGGFFGFVFSIALALYLLFLATNTLSEFYGGCQGICFSPYPLFLHNRNIRSWDIGHVYTGTGNPGQVCQVSRLYDADWLCFGSDPRYGKL